MDNTPNIFTSNSRYLPPPIRTVHQSNNAYSQGWTPTPTSVISSNFSTKVPLSSSSSELPPPRSDYSHSEDGSEEGCDAPSSAGSRVGREPFSPEPSFSYQPRLPHVLPDHRVSLSVNDLQSLTVRRHSGGTDSYHGSRSLGNGSPSLNKRARSSSYSANHQQTRSWPVAPHPSATHSHPTPSGSSHHRNPSGNAPSTGNSPQTPPIPSSPALSAENESVLVGDNQSTKCIKNKSSGEGPQHRTLHAPPPYRTETLGEVSCLGLGGPEIGSL